ncbi:M48 family metallopeptidase [Anaeromyxobacter oryzae]|uniref:Peptidase M48 n=1 Tax=Anaeromyxobacter oryzae TaxID=2918170 RepID=A0ABN6MS02_9BACT|nr:M48 family metallopeptidase [Anaeromyxobacter oryzae]BDG03767.1 peptidase M48 [Anaeromyxobacter oryzae]
MPTSRPLALATILAALACSSAQRTKTETELANVLVPPEQEKQLGVQVKQQLEQEQHVQYIDDPTVTSYVNDVAGKILAQAKKDRPDVQWTVSVINDPKQVNAFATPGGYLYVYSGLLEAADDTAEVAGVLGHESGHVVARHSARQMVDQFGLETLASIALGNDPGAASKLAAGLAGQTGMLAFSRADESEADEYGARYASAAGYDPHGLVTFFQKLEKGEGKQPGWARYLSTHPLTPDRITKIEAYIQKNHLTGSGGTSSTEIAKVKERLKSIPPPPEQPKTQTPPGGTSGGGTQPAPGGGK